MLPGNTANAYYNGTQVGSPAQLRAAILNPANWISAPVNYAANLAGLQFPFGSEGE